MDRAAASARTWRGYLRPRARERMAAARVSDGGVRPGDGGGTPEWMAAARESERRRRARVTAAARASDGGGTRK
eukprot:5803488-Prymnesium_polylepis.1